MTEQELRRATMRCPECAEWTVALPDSTLVVAWYTCSACGHDWSARLRDGRPAVESSIDAPAPEAGYSQLR